MVPLDSIKKQKTVKMKFDLTMEDYTILLNALHYYKKVEKRGNFQQYTDEVVNELRDRLAKQISPSPFNDA